MNLAILDSKDYVIHPSYLGNHKPVL